VGWRQWLRGVFSSGSGPGLGEPKSANGASSFHLTWALPAGTGSLVEVSAVLTVVEPPSVDRLYFWALQVSFEGSSGAGAHIGLQWLPGAPRSRAANWGGYLGGGGELNGTPPANTRPCPWEPGVPYTLTVRRGNVGWVGTIADPAGTVLFTRELDVPGGQALSDPVVWSEVFARCDHPSTTVRWSDMRAVTTGGAEVRPVAALVNYQSAPDGGCPNTNSSADGDALVQTTSTARVTAQGSSLRLAPL
jgi:hypothetical protein